MISQLQACVVYVCCYSAKNPFPANMWYFGFIVSCQTLNYIFKIIQIHCDYFRSTESDSKNVVSINGNSIPGRLAIPDNGDL